MAGCGYVCPVCEGKGFTDNGEVCDFCSEKPKLPKNNASSSDKEEWIKNVHEGPCCAGDDR